MIQSGKIKGPGAPSPERSSTRTSRYPQTEHEIGRELTSSEIVRCARLSKALFHSCAITDSVVSKLAAQSETFGPEFIDCLIDLAKAAGKKSALVLQNELNAGLQHFPAKLPLSTFRDLSRIARASRRDIPYLFAFSLGTALRSAGARVTPARMNALAQIAQAAGPQTRTVFDKGLPAAIDIVYGAPHQKLREAGLMLAKLAKLAGPHAGLIFENTLPALLKKVKTPARSFELFRKLYPKLITCLKTTGPEGAAALVEAFPLMVENFGTGISTKDCISISSALRRYSLNGNGQANLLFYSFATPAIIRNQGKHGTLSAARFIDIIKSVEGLGAGLSAELVRNIHFILDNLPENSGPSEADYPQLAGTLSKAAEKGSQPMLDAVWALALDSRLDAQRLSDLDNITEAFGQIRAACPDEPNFKVVVDEALPGLACLIERPFTPAEYRQIADTASQSGARLLITVYNVLKARNLRGECMDFKGIMQCCRDLGIILKTLSESEVLITATCLPELMRKLSPAQDPGLLAAGIVKCLVRLNRAIQGSSTVCPRIQYTLDKLVAEKSSLQYLEGLADIVEAAREPDDLFNEALPAAVAKLEWELEPSDLKDLARIVKTSGSQGLAVLKESLPLLIRRSSPSTVRKNLSMIAEISEAAGEESPFAIGYWISEAAKVLDHPPTSNDYRNWPAARLSAVRANVTSHPWTRAALAELVFDENQEFKEPRIDFGKRKPPLKAKPVLELPARRDIVVSAATAGKMIRLRKDAVLDSNVFKKLSFTHSGASLQREDRIKTIFQLAGKGDCPVPQSGGSEESRIIIETLRSLHNEPEKLKGALNAVRFVLPVLSGFELTVPKSQEPEAVFQFYSALKLFYGTHLPEFLQSKSIALSPETEKAFFQNFLQPINGELSKFAKNGEEQTVKLELCSAKGAFDAYYDAIGEACICSYGYELARKDFQPIRIFNPEDGKHWGVIYSLKGTVNGEPSLILAGIEIKKVYAYASNQKKLVAAILDKLAETAAVNGLTGGVYINVGGPKNEDDYSDDGRISQYEEIRTPLLDEGRAGMDKPVVLAEQEKIMFPREFSTGPISYLLKVRSVLFKQAAISQ